jgi:hypothetical protein
MKMTGEAKLLRIFIGEQDQLAHVPLYERIIRLARENGLAGATIWRGVESYGAGSRIHTAKLLELSEDLPMVIEIVDTEEKIRDFIPFVDELFEKSGGGGLVTMEKVEIIKYTQGKR